MSDNVAVMREGVIEQVADGTTIYDRPETAFVASFVGENNLFRGRVSAVDDGRATVDTGVGSIRARISTRDAGAPLRVGDPAFVFVRPESLRFADGAPGDGGLDNRIPARIRQQEFEGQFWQVFLDLPADGTQVKMAMVNDGRTLDHATGADVSLGFSADLAVALPEGPLAAE